MTSGKFVHVDESKRKENIQSSRILDNSWPVQERQKWPASVPETIDGFQNPQTPAEITRRRNWGILLGENPEMYQRFQNIVYI